jgi:hypothetical protein
MPQNLKSRQISIQDKRKKTKFRDFVKEICSWTPLNLYRREWGLISRYPDKRVKNILPPKEYEYNIMWTQKSVDWNFLDLYADLYLSIDHSSLIQQWTNSNSEYVDVALSCKDWYLSFAVGGDSEWFFYSAFCWRNCTNILNSMMTTQFSENIYQSLCITNSTNIYYSRNVLWSSNIWFSINLIGCQECISCHDLQNQSYCINNKQLDKETYLTEKKRLLAEKEKFDDYHAELFVHPASVLLSENIIWQYMVNSNNIEDWRYLTNISHWRNVILWWGWTQWSSHYYDGIDVWTSSEHFYWVNGVGWWSSHIYLSNQVVKSHNIYYSYDIESCSYCLGCIWLKNKSYCILNQQYTKEERHQKVDEIFTQMDETWSLGCFFPWTMNPFYFNDTVAYLIDDSFTKEEVLQSWLSHMRL